jgi:hypothetical protein
MIITFIPIGKHGQRAVAVSTEFDMPPVYDTAFLKALGRAYYWQSLIDGGKARSGVDIAAQEGLAQETVNKILRLTRLCPDIVKMLMTGQQPRNMTLQYFIRNNFPVGWEEQMQLIKGSRR